MGTSVTVATFSMLGVLFTRDTGTTTRFGTGLSEGAITAGVGTGDKTVFLR